jgi:hypothetical protein
VFYRGCDEFFLGWEVVLHRALGKAGVMSDAGNGGFCVTDLGQQRDGCLAHALTRARTFKLL